MNPSPPSHRVIPAVLFGLLSFAGLRAASYDTVWKIVPARDSSGNWKQAIRVETVPGVVYHLQFSPSLALPGTPGWTTVATRYGMGESWICPVLPGHPPSPETPESEIVPLPDPSASPLVPANLTLGRNSLGQTTLSWMSLDDHTPKQKVFTGLAVDPAWDEYDGFYLRSHGTHFFGIGALLAGPSAITTSSSSFGPSDSAMLADFEAGFGEMAANIANGVTSETGILPPPSDPGPSGYYRILADWSADSNGGGRYDWEQLVLDGTDPFGPGGGPGGSDAVLSGGGSGSYPTPGDVPPAPPRAVIQQRVMMATYGESILYYDGEAFPRGGGTAIVLDPDGAYVPVEGAEDQLDEISDVGELIDALKGFPFPQGHWADGLSTFRVDRAGEKEDGLEQWNQYSAWRSQFRLKLGAPAPEGGYSIPMRLLRFRTRYNASFEEELIPSGEEPFVDIILEVAAGRTEGEPVEVPLSGDLDENTFVHYVPANVVIADGYFDETDEIPADGMCKEVGEYFTAKFCERAAFESVGPPDTEVRWQKRGLRGDGTFGSWTPIENFNEMLPAQGMRMDVPCDQAGIFQMRALVVLPDGTQVDFPFLRMGNARGHRNSAVSRRGFFWPASRITTASRRISPPGTCGITPSAGWGQQSMRKTNGCPSSRERC